MKIVTIENLDTSAEQEVFDMITNHLLTQNEKCIEDVNNDTNSCKYKLGHLKCAAGCLIPEDKYNYNFENKEWIVIANRLGLTQHEDLITSLQYIHDYYKVEEWRDCLINLAKQYNLKFNHERII